jgi:colanic acid biosynthesis protein WcaH
MEIRENVFVVASSRKRQTTAFQPEEIMFLEKEDFVQIVKHAPLVSIDLVVRDVDGKILLGLRTNEPAKNFWFVPGGRIRKDEPLDKAFYRISGEELGLPLKIGDSRLLGVFEHFYSTNFAEEPGFGTHYVVLAYELNPQVDPDKLPKQQHGQYEWFHPKVLLEMPDVHRHTKAYFKADGKS